MNTKAGFADAYTPDAMALRVEHAGIIKSRIDFFSTLVLAVLAGAFIALGAVFYTVVVTESNLGFGITRLVGGMAFSLGLILVIVGGAELFTGNNLLVMAWISRKISLASMLRNWAIVYCGNFVGAMAVVLLIHYSGLWFWQDGAVGRTTISIASHKNNLEVYQAISLGILCNILVCLAVWLCYAARSLSSKILAIVFPISAFVAMGFEHSVANMYLVPAGLFLAQQPDFVAQLIEHSAMDSPAIPTILDQLSISRFLLGNLLPVTVGNIIGGGILVALVYWFIYLRPHKTPALRKLINLDPPFVSQSATLANIAAKMKAEKVDYVLVTAVRELPILGNLAGIITATDLVESLAVQNADPRDQTAQSIMRSPLISADVHCSIEQIQEHMKTNRTGHLIITDRDKLIGVLSIRAMSEQLIIS